MSDKLTYEELEQRVKELEQDIVNYKQKEEELQEIQQRNQAILKAIPDLMFRCDDKGNFLDYLVQTEGKLYTSPQKFLGKSISKVLPPAIAQQSMKCIEEAIITGGYQSLEYQLPMKDNVLDFEARYIASGKEVLIIIRDITERKRIEGALLESERQLRMMIEKSPLPMVITDDNQDIEFYNDKFIELFGYTLKDISTADKWWKTCYPDEEYRNQVMQSWVDAIEKAQATNTDIEMQEWEWTIKDGTKRLCEFYMVPLSGYSLVIMKDITDKKQSEEQIKASLKEKDTLLHEIQHRVKNNLTVISSLLSLQARRVKGQTAKSVLQDSQNKVQAMSIIHEILYRSDSLSSIDMEEYFSRLVGSIIQSYGDIQNRVTSKIAAKNIRIGVETATPLGLIVNELVTNALKYAFPENNSGEILIRLASENENSYELIVADNGIGFSQEVDLRNSDTLGLRLIKTMVEDQLEGTLDIESDKGTSCRIKFCVDHE